MGWPFLSLPLSFFLSLPLSTSPPQHYSPPRGSCCQAGRRWPGLLHLGAPPRPGGGSPSSPCGPWVPPGPRLTAAGPLHAVSLTAEGRDRKCNLETQRNVILARDSSGRRQT